MSSAEDGAIRVTQHGDLGHLRLDRPRALNALSVEMMQTIDQTLQQWARDRTIEAVLITGSGQRAFCAGGDIKSVYLEAQQIESVSERVLRSELFRSEYTMNHTVATFPKPLVAYMDGIAMGGAAGISLMGSHRLVTERTLFAMPETSIGYVPDVGATYFLSRLGPLGMLLGLTGYRIDGAVMLGAGLATHFVPQDRDQQIVEELADSDIDSALASMAIKIEPSPQLTALRWVAKRCFAASSLAEVFRLLEVVSREAHSARTRLAADVLEMLRTRSPTSLRVAFEALRRGAEMSHRQCLIMEYRLSQQFVKTNDLYEGIRSVLVDKDQSPRWSPASIDEISPAEVEAFFEVPAEGDLPLD